MSDASDRDLRAEADFDVRAVREAGVSDGID